MTKNIPKYNKWTTKQQGWQQKLSFSSSELFLPETNSEKTKIFQLQVCEPEFWNLYYAETQFSELNTKQSQKSMGAGGITITRIQKSI